METPTAVAYDRTMDDENPYRSPNQPSAADKGREREADARDASDAFAGRLTTVATYFEPIQADLARSRLEGEDIPTFIEGGEFASMAWHLSLANRGIKVQVPTEHAERASALLSETSRSSAGRKQIDEDRAKADENEPACDDDGEAEHEPQPTVREQNADRAFRGAAMGLLFLPLQLYVFWLLLKVFVSEESLSRNSRNRAFAAAAVNFPLIVLFCLFLRSLFRR